MREIKFRGKRIDNGEWVYGFIVRTKDGSFICYDGQYDDDLFISPENILIPVNPETVGQFTGLRDKNGTEIYDDDITKYSYISPMDGMEKFYIWVVAIKNGMYWLKHIGEKKHYDSSLYLKFTQIEVIGNIHENPSLLEVSR